MKSCIIISESEQLLMGALTKGSFWTNGFRKNMNKEEDKSETICKRQSIL